MLDHIGFAVKDFEASRRFYVEALAPLGVGVAMEFPGHVGLGRDGKPQLWLAQGEPAAPLHLAFVARNRAEVEAFYAAALKAGGKDNGPPGLRPQYHPNYYGAFAIDPDGHNIEAVCHSPESGSQ
ncbi:MAG TPA: VOC family protein [Roseiarcus sp.]|jgi:catechol 2,3-dioxygenase-like lactoylglutathione lyase family enzyme